MSDWLDVADPRLPTWWPGSVDLLEDDRAACLASAKVQCEAFAPVLPEGAEVPVNYLQAQALQARALSRAGIADQDRVGDYGQSVTVFPMDWQIKNLLRPQTRPVIA